MNKNKNVIIVYIVLGLLFAIVAYGIKSFVDNKYDGLPEKIDSSQKDLSKKTLELMQAAEDSLKNE